MTEPLTDLPTTLSNGTTALTSERPGAAASLPDSDTESDPGRDSPPGTPRWVKAFGIILVVLLLAFAGLHLTGNAPTHMGSTDMQHGVQSP